MGQDIPSGLANSDKTVRTDRHIVPECLVSKRHRGFQDNGMRSHYAGTPQKRDDNRMRPALHLLETYISTLANNVPPKHFILELTQNLYSFSCFLYNETIEHSLHN
ncbi:hypothetical protein ScPMuIL_003648 [Solemya velum]